MKTPYGNGLKGQGAISPGHRPGYKDAVRFALKGQKPYLVLYAFALTGRRLHITSTPGRCPGLCAYWPFRPSILASETSNYSFF